METMNLTDCPPPLTVLTSTKLKIVVNLGNANTKLAWVKDGVIVTRKVRSGILPARDFDMDRFTLNRLGDSGKPRTDYDYNPWVMAPEGDRPSGVDNGKAVYALQLFIGAAWDLIADGCTIDLHLLVHAPGALRGLLSKALSRQHDCTRGGDRKRFQINVESVAKEGLGLAGIDPNQDILILDFGGDTLIPTRFNRGRTSRELLGNAITQYGTSGLIRRLIEFAPNAIGPNPIESHCIKAIENNRLGNEADVVILDFWRDAIAAAKRQNLDLFRGTDAVYLAGGLARLKRFVAIAKNDELAPKPILNAQMADVEGFCQMLKNAGKI